MEEKLPMQPPEPEYVSEKYTFNVPYSDIRSKSPWERRLYAENLVEDSVDKDVQLTSLQIKKPSLLRRILSRVKHQEAEAKLLVTIKF